MKKILFFVSIFIIVCIGISCDNQKTALELMKEENKAISRFIDRNDLIILKTYPEDGVFGEKEYFHDSNGLYIHVIDSGNGNKVKLYQTVTARYNGMTFFKSDTSKFSTFSYKYYSNGDITNQPDEFIYGVTSSYGASSSSDMSCSGWALALSYVSENAEVSIIVPSALGTSTDNSNYRPVFYESIKFRFY